MENENNWPVLNFLEMKDTIETLHQWIQIVGKIRLKTMPWQNHSWHTTLYITANGFSTNAIPYQGIIFQIDFDFKNHKLFIQCSNSERLSVELKTRTVASFYKEVFEKLDVLGIDVEIYAKPNEIDPATPFAENTLNKKYDPEVANKLWLAMLKANAVFNEFRSDFIGKASPVHLFWGAFDLVVTRFSGESAPLHQGGMPNMSLEVMQEAYSQEVSSAGFWPGSKEAPMPMFYSYAYPSDESFKLQKVLPKEAFYSKEFGEFVLNYEDVQKADNPEKTLYKFLQTTYDAGSNTSNWDRGKLEKK